MSRFQNFAARAAKKQVRSAWPFARTGVLVHKNSLASNLNCFVISRIWKTHWDFKWSRHRLAHVFADGWSTASHKRKRTLLEEPTGTLLVYYKYIKQEIVLKHEIVHTLLLEELGVSNSGWSSWRGDRTQMWLHVQQEKVDLRLRIVTVPEA